MSISEKRDLKDMESIMSEGYWHHWNPDEQARIEEDIEKYRKTDAVVSLGIAPGTPVTITQTKHEFKFGAHIFNFNQLGSHEVNEKYKALYGELFNSATVALYWRPHEPVEGHPRFADAPEDTEEWWNACKNPSWQANWRRPASDSVVDFCESKHLRIHGHPMVWGNPTWHYPSWLVARLPHELLAAILTDDRSGVSLQRQPLEDAIKRLPADFPAAVTQAVETRIRTLAEHYGNRLDSWDVCNESCSDFKLGNLIPGSNITRTRYGNFMPGDYCHHAFQTAMKYLPAKAKLNINDYALEKAYADQVKDMLARGDRIDCMGLQMHLFNPRQTEAIANGDYNQSPSCVRTIMWDTKIENMPTHLSEITITAPGGDARGEAIQAIVARNLYRLWFSQKNMMGITWWNVVDDCGAPGEPSTSGLFKRDMTPKQSFFVLNDLINHEWKTNLKTSADANGSVSFRGFRGQYMVQWKDENGTLQTKYFHIQ